MGFLTQPSVIIEENSPRDGIQNEQTRFAVSERIELIGALVDAGLRRIQIGSFVNEQRVPQMADTERVFDGLRQHEGVIYTALFLNEKGLNRALSCGIRHVAIFVSASQTHSLKNSNCSMEDAVRRAADLIARARAHGLILQAGVMNAFGCRYEGRVPEERVLEMVETLVEAGSNEICLADTAGLANPLQVERLVARTRELTPQPLSLHLHDTYGFGLANVYAAWKMGVSRFDASCGGLGGCPFIPNAAGNIATEDLVLLLHHMGVETGIRPSGIIGITLKLEHKLGRQLPGRAAHLPDPGECDVVVQKT